MNQYYLRYNQSMEFHGRMRLSVLMLLIISSCSTPKIQPTATMDVIPTIAPTLLPSVTPSPTPRNTPTLTQEPFANFSLQSPLEDVPLNELVSIISTTYQPPSPGWDDGHHGVDFAYWSRGTHEKMEGLGVHALMAGRVAGITNDRKPYGNQVIIETPLTEIPPQLLSSIDPILIATPFPPNPRLPACEKIQSEQWEIKPESIYTLYGHLMLPVSYQIGDMVNAGDLIGQVGTTGASVNPHLHLEMRWGPGGTEFASMGFYDTSTTDDERATYCLWRVSGKYILTNPMDVIDNWLILHPLNP